MQCRNSKLVLSVSFFRRPLLTFGMSSTDQHCFVLYAMFDKHTWSGYTKIGTLDRYKEGPDFLSHCNGI